MKKKFKNCQSCFIPIESMDDLGTEFDNQKNYMYCNLCYKNGKFIDENITLEQMQEKVFNHLKNVMHLPKFLAKILSKKVAKLERWKNK